MHALLAIFTYSCANGYMDDYDKPFDDNKLKGYRLIQEGNLSSLAIQKDSILLEIMTLNDHEIDTNFIAKYTYNVEEKLYTAKLNTSEYPKAITTVFYLKQQPSFYSFDPTQDIKKQIVLRESQEDFYFGIFWYVVTGINISLIVLAFYSSYRKKKTKREKQALKRNSKK